MKIITSSIISTCEKLYQRNLLAAADGNISYKISNQEIIITPSGVPKAELTEQDFAVITIDGDVLHGSPSSEKLLHLQVYKQCPQAQCVIHAHPPTAIAWTIAQPELTELPNHALSEVILAVGSIPITPYAKPGTNDMATAITGYLPQHRVMILARHGALSWGESLTEATNGMERIEHVAEILMRATMLGGITNLNQEEITYLQEKT